ncbi:hypothetical protein C2E21_5965 [Chlorella sorokiniana]|uniref:Uncharacterized protein n=1 Tax=Chlorella sorokiniana TaxID=3076 RepID=A0A2P6TM41_CHLSO|nr:hypothetical protein C2E21_5965 [Chlorella sorokiniana]|eukprot:PRW45410.1 hypothetical protein C2E21_5965 [Chlorella sorokiniana]
MSGQQHASARASGEQTHTRVGHTPGGGVFSVSTATSTGGGGPQRHEAAELHRVTDFNTMTTHELKAWLLARGADLTGVVERSELVDLARQTAGAGGVEDAIPPRS